MIADGLGQQGGVRRYMRSWQGYLQGTRLAQAVLAGLTYIGWPRLPMFHMFHTGTYVCICFILAQLPMFHMFHMFLPMFHTSANTLGHSESSKDKGIIFSSWLLKLTWLLVGATVTAPARTPADFDDPVGYHVRSHAIFGMWGSLLLRF